MKRIFYILIGSALLMSCGSSENSEASITGTISNLSEGASIYLDFLTPEKLVAKDTAVVDAEGNFAFDYEIEALGYYRIKINEQNFINLILDKGEKVTVTGDGSFLSKDYNVEGSAQSAALRDFNMSMNTHFMKRDSLSKLFQANANHPDAANLIPQLEQAFMAEMKKSSETVMATIEKDPSSLVSLAAIESLNPEEHFETYQLIDTEVGKKYADFNYYISFHKRFEEMKRLAPGADAPEITLPGRDGTEISLSSLKGNVVLIDFWASWCKPCRQENPNVVKAYETYNEKGFEVFSVSLDGVRQQADPKADWLAAIDADGLVWNSHVSDLKGWETPLVQAYGFQGIPFTVLVDQEGKIIGKNIRGQALHSKLAEIFGE